LPNCSAIDEINKLPLQLIRRQSTYPLLAVGRSTAIDRSVSLCCCCRLISLLLIDLFASMRSINDSLTVDTPSIDVSAAGCRSIYLLLLPVVISRSSSSGYAVNRRICCQFLYRSSFFLCRRDQ
jgi:hypothetical protein